MINNKYLLGEKNHTGTVSVLALECSKGALLLDKKHSSGKKQH